MTTSDYLESLQDDLNRTVTALELEEGTNFTDIADMAENGDISAGGGGVDINDYFATNVVINNYIQTLLRCIKALPSTLTFSGNSLKNAFQYAANLEKVELFDISNITNMDGAFAYCSNLRDVALLNTSNVTDMTGLFSGCSNLETLPAFNTANVRSFSSMCRSCSNLVNVPVLNISKATSMTNFFNLCPKLSNDSLNNIMQMCINATSFTGTKTLLYIGLSQTQAETCATLSNYDAFIAAGWTTGY